MGRLTQKDEQGNWCIQGLPWRDIYPGAVITRNTYERIYGVSQKLMEYEDTGLTPEQIRQIDVLYAKKCREVADLQKAQRWIPVEERLPEDEEMVMVTCQTKSGRRSVNRAWYGEGFWHGSGSMSGVIAWMPLPEPYRPEQTTQRSEWQDRMLHTFLGGHA